VTIETVIAGEASVFSERASLLSDGAICRRMGVHVATVLTISSRALIKACEALGLDIQSMLDAAGVVRAVIDDPDGRIEIGQARALWARAYELSGDPDLALHAAEALPFGAYKVIELPVDVGAELVHVGARASIHPEALTRQYAEYVFAAVFLRTRLAGGVAFPLRAVEFSHPAPPSSTEHERVFGCPVRFSAEACRMIIARDVWETELPRGDHGLFDLLNQHATLLIERLPAEAGLTTDVRAAIAKELRGGDTSLDHVAKKLCMSGRTLQRRLEALGVAYSELVDEMRRAVSTSYLADRELALCEVAYLLGFSEQSSFTRAFKRWTGQTPSEYRGAPKNDADHARHP
jgi:AraC-like DNA-binding protein